MRYEERVLAFIDVLGFKEAIKKTEKDDSEQEKIYSLLSEAQEQYKNRKPDFDENKIICNHFSDSIVVSCSINDCAGVFYIFSYILFVCAYALQKGFLFRGAITKGKLFHESNLIFGPALVTAVAMEKELAIYPRIIIEDDVFMAMQNHLKKHLCKSDLITFNKKLFNKDFDGLLYINYIDGINYIVGDEAGIKVYLNSVKDKLDELRKKINCNISIKSKYLWLREKYNNTLVKYKRKYSSKSGKLKSLELYNYLEKCNTYSNTEE